MSETTLLAVMTESWLALLMMSAAVDAAGAGDKSGAVGSFLRFDRQSYNTIRVVTTLGWSTTRTDWLSSHQTSGDELTAIETRDDGGTTEMTQMTNDTRMTIENDRTRSSLPSSYCSLTRSK